MDLYFQILGMIVCGAATVGVVAFIVYLVKELFS
jgi:hypothetical protein